MIEKSLPQCIQSGYLPQLSSKCGHFWLIKTALLCFFLKMNNNIKKNIKQQNTQCHFFIPVFTILFHHMFDGHCLNHLFFCGDLMHLTREFILLYFGMKRSTFALWQGFWWCPRCLCSQWNVSSDRIGLFNAILTCW